MRNPFRPFTWLSNLRFRQKMLLAFFLLTLLPVALIGFFSYQKSESIIQQKTKEYNIDVLTEVSRNIEFKLVEISRVYYSIFTNADVQQALLRDKEGFRSEQEAIEARKKVEHLLLEAILDSDDLESIYVFSESGRQYNSLTAGYPLSITDEEKAQIAAAKGSPVWFDPDPRRLVIPGGRAINDLNKQSLIGYIVFNYKEQGLRHIYNEINLHQKGDIFLVNDQGRIISSADRSLISTMAGGGYMRQILAGGTQGFFSYDVEGKNHYIAYKQIEGTGWRIISVISAAQYEKEAISLKNWLLMIIALNVAFFLLISIMWSSNMSRPLRELARMMLRVEQGKFDVRYEYPYRDEIGVLSRNFNNMVERINYLIHKVYQEQLLQQRSELKYLKFQINPHFLFNTLDTIHWLAVLRGVPELGDMTKKLGDIMREGIKGDDFIMVDREIRNIHNYLDIQKYRFGDRMSVSIDVAEDILHIKVPKFILQPVVENAIVHGIEQKIGEGVIHIRGSAQDELLLFSVSDNGDGMERSRLDKLRLDRADDDERPGQGIGLKNVHQRIRLYYGPEYGLRIDSEPGRGTTVTICLPRSGKMVE